MQKETRKIFSITLCLACLTIGLALYVNVAINAANPSINGSSQLNVMYSTNPGSPVSLTADSGIYEYYDYSLDDYYYSCYGYSDDYLLVWLYTYDIADDFDLYLYSDSGYTNQVGSSASGSQLDWVVYRPSSSGTRYPRIYTYSGYGSAYLEYENGFDVGINSRYSFSMDYYESGELFEYSLYTSTTYTAYLEVPAGCDFNLYVFRTSSGSSTKLDLHSSATSTTGYNERIVFSPSSSDTYAMVVTRVSGTGTGYFTLYNYVYTQTRVPSFELFPALLAIVAIIGLYLTTLKRKNPLF